MKTLHTNKAVKFLIALIVCFTGLFIANKVNAAAVTTDVTDANGFLVTWEYEVSNGNAEKVRIKQVKNPGGDVIVPTEKEKRYLNDTDGSGSNFYVFRCSHEYKNVIIPDTLGGYPVTSIGNGSTRMINPDTSKIVFEDGIKYVTIPNSVTKINAYAFENCEALLRINFGTGLKEIGSYAFRNCVMVGGMVGGQQLPDSLETINPYAFEINLLGHYGVNSKNEVVNTKLSEVPEAITRWNWFYYYGGRYTFGNNINVIADFAFAGNDQMKNVTIPPSTHYIGKGAFLCCHNIENLTINDPTVGDLTIGDYAFGYVNSALQQVTIPTKAKLGKYVFCGDRNLTTVNLQNGVTSLPDGTFKGCEKLTTVNRTANFTTIGNYAFQDCKAITLSIFNNLITGTTSIGNYAFAGCTGIQGTLTVPSRITSLGQGALSGTGITSCVIEPNYTTLPAELFKGCSNLTTVTIPDSITTLGDGCFSSCPSLTLNEVQNNILRNIQTIGNNTFENCTGIEGILQLPAGIKTVGAKAFYNCSNITNVVFNDGLTKIGDEAFAEINLPEVMRFPESVTKVGRNAFSTIREAFFGAENVTFIQKWYKTRDVITHFKNCKHTVKVENALPGVRVIDTSTNQEFISGEYDCESTISLKIVIEDESQYPDLAVRMTKCGQYLSSPVVKEFLQLNAEKTITIDSLTRDTEIRLQKSQNETDLVVREFITKINGVDVNQNRTPHISTDRQENNLEPIEYQHTKYPVSIDKDDLVTYSIRIYNEDDKVGIVKKVNVYLQDGLELVKTNNVNTEYGWEEKETTNQGTIITTEYLNDKEINTYSGSGRPDFEEIQLVCKVKNNNYKTVTNIVEIVESNDADSIGGNMTLADVFEYKKTASYTSTEESFIESEEDDTDYETLELKEYAQVGYKIAIQKIDSTSLELLNGAEFNLYDENGELLESKKTVDNGKLTFSERISYGEGVETYYIEEVGVPVGYKKTIDGRLMLIVEKEIDELGNLRVKITCEANEITDYDENLHYIPITTAEQLAKIGSGEEVTIGETTYIFEENGNYILGADIDISGINWTPIKMTDGIFEGNNHKIIGMKIEDLTAANVGYTGLFSTFSGIIRNLELTNISITGDESRVNYNSYSQIAVGGLVGYMTEGKIENVTVTGNIELTKLKNIGGFIGHTGQGKVIKITNCTFNGTIDGNENVGGIVGVAKENVELVGCTSKGSLKVESGYGAAAGLIGVAEPTGDSMDNIVVEYDAANATINIAVKNKKTSGKYEVVLHKIEKLGEDFYVLDGAEFTIYDENMQVLIHNGQQLENVRAVNGKLEIADKIINSLQSDVFYIKETKAPEGYDKINELVKIVVTKRWDPVQGKYLVDFVPSVVPGKTDTPIIQDDTNSGISFEQPSEEYVIKKLNRIKVSNCINEAVIETSASNNGTGAGMIGVARGNVSIYDSVNKGKIQAVIAGGIIGQVGGDNDIHESIKVIRCSNGVKDSTDENCGVIQGLYGSNRITGGIIGVTYIDTTVDECNNYASITSQAHTGGIIALTYAGKTCVYNSGNYGELNVQSEGSGNNAGGIIGTKIGMNSSHYVLGVPCQLSIAPFELTVLDCTSKGNITGNYHIAGILGGMYSSISNSGNKLNISNCTVGSDNEEEKMVLFHSNIGSSNVSVAGILGFGYANDIKFNNNTVKNIELKTDENSRPDRCEAAGIAAHIYSPGYYTPIYSFEARNNIVENMYMDINFNRDGNRGGLFSKIAPRSSNASNNEVLTISDCKVINSVITGKDIRGYTGNAGILACYGEGAHAYLYTDFVMYNCDVINTDISTEETSTNNTQTGGLIGDICCEKVRIENCDVISTDGQKHLIKNLALNDRDYNPTGGLVGAFAGSDDSILIKKCTVKNMDIKSGNVNSKTNVGGLVGNKYLGKGTLTFDQVEMDNVEITVPNAAPSGNGAIGGVIGYSYGPLKMYDSKINNVTVNGCGTLVGGIAGLCNTAYNSSNPQCNIEGVEVNNLKINSTLSSGVQCNYGGFIGYVSAPIKIENNKVDGLELSINHPRAELVGGLIGLLNDTGEINNNDIKNVKIINDADSWGSGNPHALGGFVGFAYKNINVSNNKLDNLEIETFVSHVGGLVGYAYQQVDANENELSNIKLVANNKIEQNRSYDGYTYGGLVGLNAIKYTDYSASPSEPHIIKINANNNKIDKLQILINAKAPKVHVGGFAGVTGDLSVINDNTSNAVTISNFEAKNASQQGTTGGIAGVVMEGSHSVLKNIKAKNLEVEGNYAVGGLLGCGEAKIDTATVTNMDAVIEEETIPAEKASIVGGIAGIATELSEITNVEVNADANTTHELKSNYVVGGIAGICSGKLQNALVKNIKVTTLADVQEAQQPETTVDEDTEPIIDTILRSMQKAQAIVVLHAQELINCRAQNVIVTNGTSTVTVNE
ncbi:MAG: leucine-rich repeat protein [Clostridia bacterium]|nr:leucine-rich repeat protein [Clostridia bacterium]